MLQDPNVERYVQERIEPLKEQIKEIQATIFKLMQANNLHLQNVSGSDTITLTHDELNSFLQDWSAGYSAEEQYLSWDEKSLKIVNFLGLDE